MHTVLDLLRLVRALLRTLPSLRTVVRYILQLDAYGNAERYRVHPRRYPFACLFWVHNIRLSDIRSQKAIRIWIEFFELDSMSDEVNHDVYLSNPLFQVFQLAVDEAVDFAVVTVKLQVSVSV